MTDPIAVEKVALITPSDSTINALRQQGFRLYAVPQAALDALPAAQVWIRCQRKKVDASPAASDSILSDPAVRVLTDVESHAISTAHAKQYR